VLVPGFVIHTNCKQPNCFSFFFGVEKCDPAPRSKKAPARKAPVKKAPAKKAPATKAPAKKSVPVLARVGGSKNKREESPVKSMTEPVVGRPLCGASFLILTIGQDRKPPSTFLTNFISLIFVVVPPKKKSQKTAPPSKNAFDNDDEDDDFNDSVDVEGMTMPTLPLSVLSPPFVHASPVLCGRASFESLTFQFAEGKRSNPKQVRRRKQISYAVDSDSDEDSADEFGTHPRHTTLLYLLW
jgi:hypothetical protein